MYIHVLAFFLLTTALLFEHDVIGHYDNVFDRTNIVMVQVVEINL